MADESKTEALSVQPCASGLLITDPADSHHEPAAGTATEPHTSHHQDSSVSSIDQPK